MELGSTQQLIARTLDGEAQARDQLLERLRPRLMLWATSRLSPALRAKVEPDDVAQETLLAVHRSLGGFEGRSERAFLAWLFHIAENRIRDLAAHFGAKKRQPVPPLTFTQTSPSTAIARSEEVGRVVAALELLREDYRDVLRLRRFEEREVRDVAEIMGRTENAVRILYCRALKALRAALEGSADPGAGA